MQLKKGFYLILLMLFIPLMGILYLNNTYKKSIESVKIPVVMPSQIVHWCASRPRLREAR
jgi:hypothetical protein